MQRKHVRQFWIFHSAFSLVPDIYVNYYWPGVQLKPTQIDSKKTKWTHMYARVHVCKCVHTNLLHPLCQCAPFYVFIEQVVKTHDYTCTNTRTHTFTKAFELWSWSIWNCQSYWRDKAAYWRDSLPPPLPLSLELSVSRYRPRTLCSIEMSCRELTVLKNKTTIITM